MPKLVLKRNSSIELRKHDSYVCSGSVMKVLGRLFPVLRKALSGDLQRFDSSAGPISFSFSSITMLNKNKKNAKRRPRGAQKPRTTPGTAATLERLIHEKIPASLMSNAPFPSDTDRKLSFRFVGPLTAVAQFQIKEFRINGAFQPDGASSPSGFAQLAAIYGEYKVTNFRCRYNVAANEPGVPVFFGLIFRDVQPSTTLTTWTLVKDALEIAPTTGPQLVGETTGTSIYKSPWYKVHPSAIQGNPLEYMGSTLFGAAVTSNPSDLLWVAFLCQSHSSGTNGCGLFLDIFLELTVHFYSLIVPPT